MFQFRGNSLAKAVLTPYQTILVRKAAYLDKEIVVQSLFTVGNHGAIYYLEVDEG